jgi:hypothetical protein
MRSLGYLLIFLVFFCTTFLGLRLFLPPPDDEGIARKVEFIKKHRHEIDTLFIGSSRVYHGLNPKVFDAITAEAGLPTHSYNFGVDAMLPPETFYVADQILAAQLPRLRWVFIELEDVQVSMQPEQSETRRVRAWHDWKRTWIVTRKLLDADVNERWKQKRKRLAQNWRPLATHYRLFLQNLANAGRSFDLTHFYPVEQDATPLQYEPQGDGYAPTMVRMDAERQSKYRAWVAGDPAVARPREVDRYADRAFRYYVGRFRSIGATPVFFVTPGSAAILPSKFIEPQPAPVLAFNDAKEFPSLYLENVRIDEGHLNAAGADEFTTLLARRFLSWKRNRKR